MTLKLLTALVVASLGLMACGDGTPVAPAGPTEIDVTIADGYIGGATAWLDLDEDGVLDAGEPSGLSGNNGVVTLEIPAGTDTNHPIVVDVPVGATDSDQPGGVFAKAFTLKTPAGKTFVSALTTMVQAEIESGNNPRTAEANVGATYAFGDIGLYDDFVAGEANSVSGATETHSLMVVLTTALADGLEDGLAAVPGADTSTLLQLITQHLKAEALTVTGLVLNPPAGGVTVASFDTNSLVAEIAAQEQITSATALTAAEITTLLETGTFSADGPLSYDNFKYINDVATEAEFEYNNATNAFEGVAVTDSDDYVLTSTGWTEFDIADSSIVVNSDGSFTHSNNGLATKVFVREIDLEGNAIADYGPDGWTANLAASLASFPAGSKGYNYTDEPLNDIYEIAAWDTDNINDCFPTNLKANSFGGSCNIAPNVTTANVNDAATTLAEALYDHGTDITVAGNNNGSLYFHGLTGQVYLFKGDGDVTTSGTYKVYNGPGAPDSGSWVSRTAHNEEVIVLATPTSADEGVVEQAIIAVHDGFVRVGNLEEQGISYIENDLEDYNETAINAAIAEY